MTRVQFVQSLGTLLSDVELVLIAAPQAAFSDGGFLQDLPEEVMRTALRLAQTIGAGEGPTSARSLCPDSDLTVAIGVLPDGGSRYNSPTRAEALRRVSAEAGFEQSAKAAVLVLLDDPAHYVAAAGAVARCLPEFTLKQTGLKPRSVKLCCIDADGSVVKASPRVKRTLGETRRAARLVDTPPTDLSPKAFHTEAWKAVSGLDRVTKRAIIGSSLLRSGLGGIHAVGRTAVVEPRMLVLSYKPTQRSKKRVALVGKGVTYDTGGLSLKSGTGMSGMKADMGGAAAVLGAFCVIAAQKPRFEVHALICLAENAIGPSAYKPDDVLTLHSGLTVEINNTDAEGRLLLADGVSYAARKLKASAIYDAATLTGAQGVATGNLHAAVISNDADLEAGLVAAGQQSGDLVHPLPFAPEFYQAEFKSMVADMRNSVANRANAQVSCAAQFIYRHIADTDALWGHVDLAFPAFRNQRGTGFGVALLAQAVLDD